MVTALADADGWAPSRWQEQGPLARSSDGEPAAGSFQRWVKALDACVAFSSEGKAFQGARAHTVANQNALLSGMCRCSTNSQVSDLCGLGLTLVQKRGMGEHIRAQCD